MRQCHHQTCGSLLLGKRDCSSTMFVILQHASGKGDHGERHMCSRSAHLSHGAWSSSPMEGQKEANCQSEPFASMQGEFPKSIGSVLHKVTCLV
eukprot:193141-Amphidinium_carterae.1